MEWIEFARVERVPTPGEIVHASEIWEEPGGGGAVSAVQLAKLGDGADFFCALGDDELGHRAHEELERQGVRVHAVWREEPQRRGFVHVDRAAERTITVIGDRHGPARRDELPWERPRAGRRRLLHRRRRRCGSRRPAGQAHGGHPARARDAGRVGRQSWTRWWPAARTRASATAASSTPSRGWWCARPGPAGGDGPARRRRDRALRGGASARPPSDAYGAGDSFAAGSDLRPGRRPAPRRARWHWAPAAGPLP